jgi:hypothetical protein
MGFRLVSKTAYAFGGGANDINSVAVFATREAAEEYLACVDSVEAWRKYLLEVTETDWPTNAYMLMGKPRWYVKSDAFRWDSIQDAW